MRVIFLGTSGGMPTPRRSLPAVAVVRDGEMMLFDCGEGTQTQIMKKGLGFARLTKIFISHIHGDHISGLMGFLMTLNLLEHQGKIDLYGPDEMPSFFESLRRDAKLRTKFPFEIHPLHNGVIAREEDYHIEATPVIHRTTCYAFAIQEKVRPGRFNIDRARELGVPEGPMFSRLQQGETVLLDDGREINPAEILGSPRPGRRLVYLTDSAYNPDAVPFCRDADLLIHEAMFATEMEEEAHKRTHSTAAQAARMARDAGAKRLVLTHISPRYTDVSELRSEAREIFRETDVAKDLMEMDVPFRDE